MKASICTFRFGRHGVWKVAVLLAVTSAVAMGAGRNDSTRHRGVLKGDPAAKQVELFEAIEQKLVQVRVIPKDETGANVFIENKADEPLNVQVPQAVVAAPVLAQFGGGGGGARGGGGGGGGQAGGGGLGGGGGMGGGGMLSVPLAAKGQPLDARQLELHTVCLEHGKPDPNPRMKNYQLMRLEDYTDDPVLQEVIRQYAYGQVRRPVAQAAVWHLANGLTWQDLIEKRIDRLGRPDEPYFNHRDLEAARTLINLASHAVKERQGETSPSLADELIPASSAAQSE